MIHHDQIYLFKVVTELKSKILKVTYMFKQMKKLYFVVDIQFFWKTIRLLLLLTTNQSSASSLFPAPAYKTLILLTSIILDQRSPKKRTAHNPPYITNPSITIISST
jgi:hypothetical protein